MSHKYSGEKKYKTKIEIEKRSRCDDMPKRQKHTKRFFNKWREILYSCRDRGAPCYDD